MLDKVITLANGSALKVSQLSDDQIGWLDDTIRSGLVEFEEHDAGAREAFLLRLEVERIARSKGIPTNG